MTINILVLHTYLKIALKITLLFALTYFKMNIMEPLLSMVMTGAPILSILKVTTWNPSKQGQNYDHVVLFSQRMRAHEFIFRLKKRLPFCWPFKIIINILFFMKDEKITEKTK